MRLIVSTHTTNSCSSMLMWKFSLFVHGVFPLHIGVCQYGSFACPSTIEVNHKSCMRVLADCLLQTLAA